MCGSRTLMDAARAKKRSPHFSRKRLPHRLNEHHNSDIRRSFAAIESTPTDSSLAPIHNACINRDVRVGKYFPKADSPLHRSQRADDSSPGQGLAPPLAAPQELSHLTKTNNSMPGAVAGRV